MKNNQKSLVVTTLVAGLVTIFSTVSCSSKEQSVADQGSVSAPATETVASNDTANLGAGSSGRGR